MTFVARSSCLAVAVRGPLLTGMSIDAASPTRSLNTSSPTRSLNTYGDLLIVSGESHPAAARGVDGKSFQRLEDFVRTHWDVDEISYRRSAQDPTSYDQLPSVDAGRISPGGTVRELDVADVPSPSHVGLVEFTGRGTDHTPDYRPGVGLATCGASGRRVLAVL